ncbi:hypothetical protein CVT24_010637 [Panaeolus cyanescens]|uniref:Uncharacterized protein n=1 Tax=Panaeolus cyanescens TaxID=181874 RepID=A0A409YM23_9AGAR|nr:hypothetical protein CVT24_010637 [Panaeolus cyanescens]
MRAFAVLFCLFASSLAYSVTRPSTGQGWNNDGGQVLSWQRVDTDRANFTAVLINPNQEQQILAALVDGTLGTAKMNPPSGGWPTGNGFRVRLVRDSQSLSSILAESQTFEIEDVPVTLRTATSTLPTTAPTNAPTTSIDQGTPIPTTGAASSVSVQTALVAFMSMLGFALV